MSFNEGALLGKETIYTYQTEKNEISVVEDYALISVNNPAEIKQPSKGKNIFDKDILHINKSMQMHYEIDSAEEDSIEEPKLHPLIPSGAGLFAIGVAATAVSVLSGGLSIFIGIGAMIAGILLTNFGYKKVKEDPKKWKGEKLALAVYYTLIPVGLLLMFYPLYLLFLI
ncbi:MAG: hypothetical protein H7Y00_13645 [Fimbriimonadaceae bacterium]|nr:hypothetical protein [Chitinophagales bacterium]